jgi:hypothetical protein
MHSFIYSFIHSFCLEPNGNACHMAPHARYRTVDGESLHGVDSGRFYRGRGVQVGVNVRSYMDPC